MQSWGVRVVYKSYSDWKIDFQWKIEKRLNFFFQGVHKNQGLSVDFFDDLKIEAVLAKFHQWFLFVFIQFNRISNLFLFFPLQRYQFEVDSYITGIIPAKEAVFPRYNLSLRVDDHYLVLGRVVSDEEGDLMLVQLFEDYLKSLFYFVYFDTAVPNVPVLELVSESKIEFTLRGEIYGAGPFKESVLEGEPEDSWTSFLLG